MTVLGIGLDLVETARIRDVRDRHPRFAARICTARELDAIGPDAEAQSLAGRFAAKEAVAKCLGVPLRWHDVEVLPNPTGRPIVTLHDRALVAAKGEGVLVSITHTRSVAAAVALWVEG